jgi:hypothetical protein
MRSRRAIQQPYFPLLEKAFHPPSSGLAADPRRRAKPGPGARLPLPRHDDKARLDFPGKPFLFYGCSPGLSPWLANFSTKSACHSSPGEQPIEQSQLGADSG